ncbi:MAG: hypothetical protein ABFS34_10555 [Gemmatimonadota bacterium]
MDWDGIGTLAMFLSTGAVGLAVVIYKAYRERLRTTLEKERLKSRLGLDDELLEEMRALKEQVKRLEDRADFTDRLLKATAPVREVSTAPEDAPWPISPSQG